jgi:aminoglycoside 6'-N-acetyltransferase
MIIISPRLIIRKLRIEDAEDYHAIFGDTEIAKYDDYELTTLEEAKDTIHEYIEIYDKNPIEIEYGVELIEQTEIIGIINLLREVEKLYIGFHFKPSFHGKGYASEALEAVIHHLNTQLFAKVDPENARSIGLLNKLGFHFVEEVKLASGKKEHIYRHAGK